MPRPPLWFFVVVALLVAIGIIAPLTVTWYQHRTQRTAPVDTTGNTPQDSLRLGSPPAGLDSTPRAHRTTP